MASPQTVKYAIKQVFRELILDCVQAQRGQLSLEKTLTPHSSSLNLASVCTLGMWHCYFFPFLIECNYLEKKKSFEKTCDFTKQKSTTEEIIFQCPNKEWGRSLGKVLCSK